MGDKKYTQLGLFGGEDSAPRRSYVPRLRTKKHARPDWSPRRRAAKGELTCGDCRWLRIKTFPGCDATHPKCGLTANGGWSTTIAYRDAACSRFEAPAKPAPEPTEDGES